MTTFSFERKYSRTAFFSHSLTTHFPSIFSATRAWPESSSPMLALMATFNSAPTLLGVISARRSNAASIVVRTCSKSPLVISILSSQLFFSQEGPNPLRRLDALRHRRHERNPHPPRTRVLPGSVSPGQIASRQHRKILPREQLAC